MSMPEQAGKVASSVIDVMKGTPMLMVVLLINAAFLGSLVYLMGVATTNAGERNKQQLALIEKLASRDCYQGPRGSYDPTQKSMVYRPKDTP